MRECQNCIPEFCNKSSIVEKLEPTSVSVREASAAYLTLVKKYEEGFAIASGRYVTPGKLEEFRDAFNAGMFDDDDAYERTLGNIANRLDEIEKHRIKGYQRIEEVSILREQFWSKQMIPLVESVSGPKSDAFPFYVFAVRGSFDSTSGISVKNHNSQTFKNVCFALKSSIGAPETTNAAHYVFVKVIGGYQEVMFPVRYAEGLIQPDSNPKMGKTVSLSFWSSEAVCRDQVFELPKNVEVARKTRTVKGRLEWVPFHLKLTPVSKVP